MTDYFINLINVNDVATRNFNIGFLTGVGIALAVIIVLFILRLVIAILFRRKGCNGITMNGEYGDIFVSAAAITSAVMSQEQLFKAIVVQKVKLFKSSKGRVSIWVQICFDAGTGCLAPQSKALQQSILKVLKDTFGITNIDKIQIVLKDMVHLNLPAAQPEMPGGTPIQDIPVFAPIPLEKEQEKLQRGIFSNKEKTVDETSDDNDDDDVAKPSPVAGTAPLSK